MLERNIVDPTNLSPVKRRLDQLIRMAVNRVSRAYSEQYLYTPRWHVHQEMLRRAQSESADYVAEHMSHALVMPTWEGVLKQASDETKVDGMHMEFGVRTGGTMNLLAKRNPTQQFHGFDSFEGLPEPWTGWWAAEGAFKRSAIPKVADNVELIVGWFNDTLPGFMEQHEGPVAFVHADADLYSSTVTILDNVGPRLIPGSVIVFNEYFNYPNWKAHEYKAWQEFCTANDVEYEYLSWGFYEVAVRITSIRGES